MTYFKDLTIYEYSRKPEQWPLENNVGWLGPGHTFPTAQPTESLLGLIWIWAFCRINVNPTRGVHLCHICHSAGVWPLPALSSSFISHGTEQRLLGSAEIRAFSNRGAIFAAPNLIYHYIAAHHYKPPEEFADGLSEGPCPPDPEYIARIEKLGCEWSYNSHLRKDESI